MWNVQTVTGGVGEFTNIPPFSERCWNPRASPTILLDTFTAAVRCAADRARSALSKATSALVPTINDPRSNRVGEVFDCAWPGFGNSRYREGCIPCMAREPTWELDPAE